MGELKLFTWENDERLLPTPTFFCLVCGLGTDAGRVAGMLLEERGGLLPRKLGDVCLECLVAGKRGAVQRARARAEYYLNIATEAPKLSRKLEPQKAKAWAAERESAAETIEQMTDWIGADELLQAREALAEMEATLENKDDSRAV